MARFIIADAQLAQDLTEDLSGSLFRSPEVFVRSYNEGLLSANSNVVKEYVDRIVAAYKDVYHKNKRFTFISESEIFLAEILDALVPWADLTRLKREVSDLVADSHLRAGDFLYATSGGDWSLVTQNEYENSFEKLESLSKVGKAAYDVVHSAAESSDDNGFFVQVQKILDLDEEFIGDAHAVIVR